MMPYASAQVTDLVSASVTLVLTCSNSAKDLRKQIIHALPDVEHCFHKCHTDTSVMASQASPALRWQWLGKRDASIPR